MEMALVRLTFLVRRTLLKFASVGVINTLLTLAVIFGLKFLFAVSDPAANLAGYMIGLACSFMLNKRWTFQHSAATFPALWRFLLVFGASYILNIVVVLTFIRLGFNNYLAHLAGMPFYTIAFYFGCRDFAFVNRPGKAQVAVEKASVPGLGRWYIATLAVLVAVLFYRLSAAPLEIWDEARLANNALEMTKTGWSLVTTYDGSPDHWNTKPPLLIWLMAMSIHLLGANEWAVRLPSALAAIGTASIVFWFCSARMNRPLVGFVAALAMSSMPGYVVCHGARAGDYDAMLTLWTTAYVLAGYMFVHASRERRTMWLSICSICIILAFLTKTVQGFIFLPALFAYVCLQGRLSHCLRTRAFYINMAVVLAVCVGYYIVREQIDPGYFAAVRDNDLGGRYASVLEGHQGGILWYLTLYTLYPWIVPGFIAAAYIIWRDTGEPRKICWFLVILSSFYIAVISLASTKLPWYLIPVCPLVVIPIAILSDRILAFLHGRLQTKSAAAILVGVCVVAGAIVVVRNVVLVERQVNAKIVNKLDRYNVFLRSLPIRGKHRHNLVVIHPGYRNAQGDPFYVATTLFYVNRFRDAGQSVVIQPILQEIPDEATSIVLCGKHFLEKVAASVKLHPMSIKGECGIYEIQGRRFGK
jgi:4-amino-4-deoxy-L-arabinose transferase-like glycosyltransferase/putative flippase GtrA